MEDIVQFLGKRNIIAGYRKRHTLGGKGNTGVSQRLAVTILVVCDLWIFFIFFQTVEKQVTSDVLMTSK